jgi:hypothetical protein
MATATRSPDTSAPIAMVDVVRQIQAIACVPGSPTAKRRWMPMRKPTHGWVRLLCGPVGLCTQTASSGEKEDRWTRSRC